MKPRPSSPTRRRIAQPKVGNEHSGRGGGRPGPAQGASATTSKPPTLWGGVEDEEERRGLKARPRQGSWPRRGATLPTASCRLPPAGCLLPTASCRCLLPSLLPEAHICARRAPRWSCMGELGFHHHPGKDPSPAQPRLSVTLLSRPPIAHPQALPLWATSGPGDKASMGPSISQLQGHHSQEAFLNRWHPMASGPPLCSPRGYFHFI